MVGYLNTNSYKLMPFMQSKEIKAIVYFTNNYSVRRNLLALFLTVFILMSSNKDRVAYLTILIRDSRWLCSSDPWGSTSLFCKHCRP